jgi:hypothetical protein
MKKIKLSGREVAVLRAIDFTMGTIGAEILERTQIEPGDLLDLINSLLELGYIETSPPSEIIAPDALNETMLGVNPSFVHDLREAISRR